MRNKPKSTKRVRLWPIEIFLGIVLVVSTFFITSNRDMEIAQTSLSNTVRYIKNQCNQYSRMNLASETKSLMRAIESTRQIERELSREKSERVSVTEEILQSCAVDHYMTGVLLLGTDGNVKAAYYGDELGEEALREALGAEVLLNTAQYPEKSYAVRLENGDGSYVDLAAVALGTGEGIVVSYYHTDLEYVKAFSLSVDFLLSGYNQERMETIVISSGERIVASTDETLIGRKTDDIDILSYIKKKGSSDRLVHTRKSDGTLSQNFGLMEHGRDYYIYAYVPENYVFENTFQYVFYALIAYLIVLSAVNMVRFRTAQEYRESQLKAQKEYADSLQGKNMELKKALEEADRANAAKTNFLARVSHDIRTPLNGIIGLLEIDEAHMEDKALLTRNQKKMKVAAMHLLSLINDILQMSKLESGEMTLAHEPMDLKKLSEDVLTIVEQRAADAGVTLEYDRNVERKVSCVYGSPLHVRQIFLNIYGNCIKYNKLGGKVTTLCTCEKIGEGMVTYRWEIRDTGIGMSQEFLNHIFEPFAQEKVDARSVYNGTGLGMSIVKSLIEKMGGSITITSKEGVGSCFTVILPFEIAEDMPKEEKEEKKQVSVEGLHLILAEDNELNAEIAETLLGDKGITVSKAWDGQQAVELFEKNPPGTFDGILMDVMMPGVDGLLATRKIRALDREDAGSIPIIAMTANAYEEDVKKCLEAGMNAHLSKPLQMDKVIYTIAKFCR